MVIEFATIQAATSTAGADERKTCSNSKDGRHHPNTLRYCTKCGLRLTDTLFGWVAR